MNARSATNGTHASGEPRAQAAGQPAPAGLAAFIGVGPGDEGLLTLGATELLAAADLVVGRPEVTGRLAHRLRAGASVAAAADPDADARALIKAARAGQVAVALFGGDPFLFSRAAPQADACAGARVPVEIVPGVSAATAVPAFSGIPLTAGAGGMHDPHAAGG